MNQDNFNVQNNLQRSNIQQIGLNEKSYTFFNERKLTTFII